MKNFMLLALCSIMMLFANGQQTGSSVYLVHLTDKGLKKSVLVNPAEFLSARAAARRVQLQIPFDQSDIPVNEAYVQQISNAGAHILSRSRWFNTVLLEASNQVADKISLLPFVAQLQTVQTGKITASGKSTVFNENVTTTPNINKGVSVKHVTADTYNYGTAFNQINQLKGQYLHNLGFAGQGKIIAVLDAGFNSVDIMSCFDSLRAGNQILGVRDFAVPGNNVYDVNMNSHGTKVLSCMGANISGQMVGTAPKASYWLLRSEVGESESIIEEYYWAAAAEFADSVGADLINSSLGYTTFDNPATNHTYADLDGKTTVVTKAAEKAAQKGILVVNSAGNSGGGGWWYINAPADGDSVLTVGAVDASGVRVSFSSVGPTADGRIKPTVAAQGLGCTVFGPSGFSLANGTSFSSPIVCGLTACLWQAMPGFSNMQIIEAIKSTASQASSPDTLLGWGIPDYSKALIFLPTAENSVAQNIIIYPNPVKDQFTVGLPVQISSKCTIEIVNLQGSIVYENEFTASSRAIQVDNLQKLVPGIYVVRVKNGASVFSSRMLKI